eukprot:COSAG06_NODE_46150_length_349_cov_0.700000_2_plen_89_part_01
MTAAATTPPAPATGYGAAPGYTKGDDSKSRTRANATLYLAATRKKLAEEEKEAAKEAAIAEEAARLKREQQAEIAASKARKLKEAAEME